MQTEVPEFDPCFPGRFKEVQGVGRGAGQDRGAEILEEHGLTSGPAPGNRKNGCAQFFHAVMDAQTAGEQTIAVSIVDGIPGRDPGRGQGPGHESGPVPDIPPGITYNR